MYKVNYIVKFKHFTNTLTRIFKLYICKCRIQLAITTLSFDNRLPKSGHFRSNHVEVSCIYKLLSFNCYAFAGINSVKQLIAWNMANVKQSAPYLIFSAHITIYSRKWNQVKSTHYSSALTSSQTHTNTRIYVVLLIVSLGTECVTNLSDSWTG